jgi:hypothetical protein
VRWSCSFWYGIFAGTPFTRTGPLRIIVQGSWMDWHDRALGSMSLTSKVDSTKCDFPSMGEGFSNAVLTMAYTSSSGRLLVDTSTARVPIVGTSPRFQRTCRPG